MTDETMTFEVWIDNDGDPGMFSPATQTEEGLKFLREGKLLAVFYDVTWERAKKAMAALLGY